MERSKEHRLHSHQIRFANGASRDLIQSVRPIVNEAIASAQVILPLETDVKFAVVPDFRKVVSRYMHGSTGWTPDSGHVHIGVNTRTKSWQRSLRSTVAHELNHTVRHHRMGTHANRGELNMQDTIAFEGLAQCFETEVTGRLPPYARELTAKQVRKTWMLVKNNLDSLDDDFYRRVFFARKDREVPTWAGYRISYMIVSRMKERSGSGWDALMGLSSEEIVGPGATLL